MEYLNNMSCIKSEWLFGSYILLKSNYILLKGKKYIDILSCDGCKKEALMIYIRIPERFEEKIRVKIGNLYQATLKNLSKYRIIESNTTSKFSQQYIMVIGKQLFEKDGTVYRLYKNPFNASHTGFFKMHSQCLL